MEYKMPLHNGIPDSMPYIGQEVRFKILYLQYKLLYIINIIYLSLIIDNIVYLYYKLVYNGP